MSEPHVTFDEATNTYLTIVCAGSPCPCSCEGGPPEPPEPPSNCCGENLEDCYGYAIQAGGDGWWHSDDGAFTVEKGDDGKWRGSSPVISIDSPATWGPINYMNCTGATTPDLQVDIEFWFEDPDDEGNYCKAIVYSRWRTSNEVLAESTLEVDISSPEDCPPGPYGSSVYCGGDECDPGFPDQSGCAEWTMDVGWTSFYDTLCPIVCDMECVTVAFGGTTSESHTIGDPAVGGFDLTRSCTAGQICDQDTITATLTVTGTGPTAVSWEVKDCTQSNAIWTLVSKSHDNGDTGTGALTLTYTWRYNADGVGDGDIDESCCLLALPELGVEYGPLGPHEYFLTSGRNGSGSMSICGTI